MKVGIVGSGFVGAAAGYAMVLRNSCREIVFLDANKDKAEAEAARPRGLEQKPPGSGGRHEGG